MQFFTFHECAGQVKKGEKKDKNYYSLKGFVDRGRLFSCDGTAVVDASRWEGPEEEGVGTRGAAVGGRVEEEVLEEEGSVSGLLAVTGPVACIIHKSLLYTTNKCIYMYINKRQYHTIYILAKYSNGSSAPHSANFFSSFFEAQPPTLKRFVQLWTLGVTFTASAKIV